MRSSRPLILLALILIGHVLLWWFRPFTFLDDIDSQHYVRLASEIVEGKFRLATHPFNDRLGVTAPAAVVYSAFGIGARATTLWPIVASVLTIVVVFAAARRAFGANVALMAALLLAATVIQVEYAVHLLPDIIVSGLMVGSAALLCAARDGRQGAARRSWLLGGLCAMTLLGALLTKTSVVWAGPFFLGVMVYDLKRRRHVQLWTAMVIVGAACLGLLFFSYYLATGNPLNFLSSIETAHNTTVWSATSKGSALLDRLTLAPVRFLIEELGYGPLILLAIPALIHTVRPLRFMPSGLRFWSAYAAVVLLSFWFGTTSLHSYAPLPLAPRYLIPLLPPLAILGGVTLSRFLLEDEHGRAAHAWMLFTAAAFAGAALMLRQPARSTLYGGLALTLAFLATPARHIIGGRLAKIARIAVPVVLSLGILVYHGLRDVRAPNPLRVIEREFTRRYVAPLPKDALVFTDEHSAVVLPLLLQRDGRNHLSVADWSDAGAVRAKAGAPAFVFVNQTTLSMMNEWWDREIPRFATEPPPHWERLANHAVPSGILNGLSLPFNGQRILLLKVDDPAELLLR